MRRLARPVAEAALRWSAMSANTAPACRWAPGWPSCPTSELVRLLELRPDLHPAAAGHDRGAGRPRAGPPVGQGRHRRARLPAPRGARRAADPARRHRRRPLAALTAPLGGRAEDSAFVAAVDEPHASARWSGATPRAGALRVAAETASACPGTRDRRRWSPTRRPATRSPRRSTRSTAAERDLLRPADRGLADRPDPRRRCPAPRPTGRCNGCSPPDCCASLDADTVILPRLVGQVLRGEVPGSRRVWPDRTRRCRPRPAADVDAVAAGAALDLMREVELVLETLSATPVPELRSGGLGVRDVKRLTKPTGIDERRLGLILEVALVGGSDRSGHPRAGTARRGRPVLGADRGRRPVHRIADRGASGI